MGMAPNGLLASSLEDTSRMGLSNCVQDVRAWVLQAHGGTTCLLSRLGKACQKHQHPEAPPPPGLPASTGDFAGPGHGLKCSCERADIGLTRLIRPSSSRAILRVRHHLIHGEKFARLQVTTPVRLALQSRRCFSCCFSRRIFLSTRGGAECLAA